jgi:hypothetical protein
VLRVSHPWFKLEPRTVKIIDAFNSTHLKITNRLKDRKDLHTVANILRELAKYLYSVIPELSGKDEEVSGFGERALMKFADDLEALPAYAAEPRPLATKERASRKLVGVLIWLVGLFSHENPLVKFWVWWALVQLIAILAVTVALQSISALKLDSALIVFAIGTPLLVAAATLATPTRKK